MAACHSGEMMHESKEKNKQYIYILTVVLALVVITGCASERYMIDDPVNDPIMTCDDQQDSDLVRVEEGGGGAAGGGCPT